MKTSLTLFLLALVTVARAQFTIEDYVSEERVDYASVFPIISSAKNPDAAERVNIILHHEMLEKVYQTEDDDRFGEVFPPEGEIWGASEFEYKVLANNERFFCVSITCSYTGAYSEYYTTHFVFDAKSGQRLILPDLFSETVMTDLSQWVNESIIGQIDAFLMDVDTLEDYGYEQYMMYTECKDWMDGDIYETSFFLTDSTMVFKKGRCSNHMMAALDDLWDFEEEYTLDELTPLMNENGFALMQGHPLDFGGDGLATNKVLEGTIAGKYPIVAILKHSYEDSYSGVYWYKKVKRPIKLSGTLGEMATLRLTEEVNDKTTGEMELMVMTDGTLEGTWTDASGEKALDMKLEIGD